MASVTFFIYFAECHYAGCHYAECYGAVFSAIRFRFTLFSSQAVTDNFILPSKECCSIQAWVIVMSNLKEESTKKVRNNCKYPFIILTNKEHDPTSKWSWKPKFWKLFQLNVIIFYHNDSQP